MVLLLLGGLVLIPGVEQSWLGNRSTLVSRPISLSRFKPDYFSSSSGTRFATRKG